MGMVEVPRIIGLCSPDLTISIPLRVLEAMGVLPIPSPEMDPCVRVCVCVQAGICAHVFVGDRANKLSVPSPLGYQGLCELLSLLRTPLVKLTLFLAALLNL